MKSTVTAKDSFAHGARVYKAGDQVEVSIYEARELARSGLTTEPQEVETKMDEPQNKMETAISNKSTKVKA